MYRLLLFASITILSQQANFNYADQPYKSLGCWKDDIPRALTLLDGANQVLDGYYKTRESAIKKCHIAAYQKGLQIFAVQDGGQCFGSLGINSNYTKYGAATNCKAMKGGSMANDVYEVGPCREMTLNSSGPSGPAQRGFFKKHVFGTYRVSSIDAGGNVLYRKVVPFKNSKHHLFLHKNTKLGTNTWLLHQNKDSTRGYLSNRGCTDFSSLDRCNGEWYYFDNGWHTDNKIEFVCAY